ncbi:unnamed protein product, partial [Phaeothamnion confervicola]
SVNGAVPFAVRGNSDSVSKNGGGSGGRNGISSITNSLLAVEVTYELEDPRTGLVFKRDENVSGGGGGVAPHCYTTYRHTAVDVDGPRCWFPCLDNAAKRVVYDVTIALRDPQLAVLFNGSLLETTDPSWPPSVDWPPFVEAPPLAAAAAAAADRAAGGGCPVWTYRFCTEMAVHPRAVGLAVGPFRVRPLRDAERIRVALLSPSPPFLAATAPPAAALAPVLATSEGDDAMDVADEIDGA